uniref:Haloacid dehalogenase-like hydrolase domain-containing protein 3 n=1 Tax=Latimeria chalumnae TaxID=7897 RepID=H3BAI4_LATCH
RYTMRLKLLTWDVKDTLLCVRRSVGEQYYAEARSRGIQVRPESLNKSFLMAYKMQNKNFPNYGLTKGLSSKQWWVDTVKQTFHLCGVNEDKILTPMAEKLYDDFCSAKNWEVFSDVREALSHCDALGIRLAVISNFDQRLERILAHCSLRHHFEFVLTSEGAGVAKPDVSIFQKALAMAKVEPGYAAHIGDDYLNDYKAARAAGMESYLVKRTGQLDSLQEEVPEEHILYSLEQVSNILNIELKKKKKKQS